MQDLKQTLRNLCNTKQTL